MNNRSGRKPKLLFAAVGLLLLACLSLVWAQRQRRVGAPQPAPVRSPKIITLKAGDDLQKAIDAAQYGDEIVLAAGASYIGTFTLPNKAGGSPGQFITIRSSAPASQLPPDGQRISPAHAPLLPKLLSPGQGLPALRTLSGAHHFRFLGVEFATRDFSTAAYELITLGDYGAAQDTWEEVPHHLVFDRCYIHALDKQSLKRGISLNSASTDIVNSYLSGFKVVGQEAQAILGWNGPGPFRIVNNYLEAAGENVMFGGSSASVTGLVPSDIELRGNHLTKSLTWREGEASYAGVRWEVKNLFELKSARRVVVEGNLFEYSWRDAQVGFALLLTPLDQDGTAPWAVVEDVLIENNIVRHAASGIQIKLYVSPARRITIRNNLFEDIDGGKWCGADCSSGHFLQVEGAEGLKVEHNTVLHTGNVVSANSAPSTNFSFSNNLVSQNRYGFHGTGRAPGSDSINFYLPNSRIRDNAIIGGDPSHYKERNMYPVSLREIKFVNPEGGDYRLRPDSPLKAKGTGGADIGADFETIRRAVFLR
ncbi:MAG TPA: hypothetical protein VGX24_08330 [Pyrinomonadaceae bacterium]|jgi:hypothetical protein|nr:hypothetical protein [Pyrinomonadaceae bacterium]